MLVSIGLHVFKLELVLLQLDGCDGLIIYLLTMGTLVLHVGILISLYAYYFTSSSILSKCVNALFHYTCIIYSRMKYHVNFGSSKVKEGKLTNLSPAYAYNIRHWFSHEQLSAYFNSSELLTLEEPDPII